MMASPICPTTPKQVIQLLVNEQSPRIVFLNAEDAMTVRKSDVWEKFHCLALDGVPIEYVACRQCKVVLGHKSRGGTSGLRHHKCTSLRFPLPATATTPPPQDTEEKIEKELPMGLSLGLPLEVNAKLKEDCIRFVAKDLRPYEITQGEGFRSLAQMFILIGVHYGNINAATLLPEPEAIGTSLAQVAEQIRIRMMDELRACHHLALSTDFWRDVCYGNSYMTVSAHYYLEDGAQLNLRTRILATKRIGSVASNSSIVGEVAWKALNEILQQYQIEKDKVTLVTDQDDLRKHALKESVCVLCSVVGSLNEIVNKLLFSAEIPDIKLLVESTDKFVSYVRKLKGEEKLDLRLDCDAPNNWGGVITKLLLVKTHLEKFGGDVQFKKESGLSEIGQELLVSVVDFLLPFKEAFEQLCEDSEPTLHLVIPWLHQLKTGCEINDADSDALKYLKTASRKLLDSAVKIGDLHTVATAMNPRMKGLAFLPSQNRNTAYSSLRQMVAASKKSNLIEMDEETAPSPPPKKQRLQNLEDLCDEVDDTEMDQVDLYLQHKVPKFGGSVISFWEEHQNLYPSLFKVVQRVLCIPASVSASDKIFNVRSRIIEERRTHLTPSSVDNVLVLQSISDYL